jgi:hypothetical protein
MLVVLVAGHPAQARDVTLKVHDMAGALPAGTRVEVQLVEDNGAPLGPVLLPRDDGVAPDAVAGDHLHTAPLAGLVADHGGITVRAEGRTWTGGFAYDATSDAVLLIGLEPSGLAAASTRELSFAQGPPGTPLSGMPPAIQGTEGGAAPLRNASPADFDPRTSGAVPTGASSPVAPAQPPLAGDAAHRSASWRGWALLVVGFGCMTAGAWFGARHRHA